MVRKKFIVLFICGLSIILSSCGMGNPVYELDLYRESNGISEAAKLNPYVPIEQETEILTF